MHACDSLNDEEYSECEPKKQRKPRKKSTSSHVGTSATPRIRHKSGAASYADLITKAILSNEDSRLSLAEIYDWMATNVASLQTQRYLHSSKGWKNAVRHTLSINPRFLKVARMGRPSWWTVESDSLPLSLTDADLTTDPISPLISAQQWASHTSLEDQDDANELELTTFRCRSGSEPAYYLSSVKKRHSSHNISSTTTKDNSITSAPSAFISSIGEDDSNVQKVKVWQNDGTVGYVTISSPVIIKATTSEDTSTQTDDTTTVGYDQAVPSQYCKDDGSFNFNELAQTFNEHPFHFLATIADDWRDLDQVMENTDDVFKPNWFENL
jgi:forkhead box protein O3